MRVTIITDASWCPTTKVAGYGFWVACERGRRRGGGTIKTLVPSSMAAEMMAMVNGLCQGMRLGIIASGDALLIQTDCQAAIDTFSKFRNPSDNVEAQVVAHMEELCRTGSLTVEYRHVKGHTAGRTPRTYVNNYCDAEAKKYMRARRADAFLEQCRDAVYKANGELNEQKT